MTPGMLQHRKSAFFLCLLLMVSTHVGKSANPFFKLKAFDISFAYKGWDIQKQSEYTDRISQTIIPVSLDIYLGRYGLFSATTASVSSSYEPYKFNSYKLSGPSDIKLSTSWYVLENHLLLTGGLNIPTGVSTLNDNQLQVASMLAQDELDFPLVLYGTGREGNIGVFVSANIWGLTVSGGASGYFRGAYQLYKDRDRLFKPSDELNLGVGLDKSFPSHSFSLDYFYTLRNSDRLGDLDALKPGNKSVLDINYAMQHYPFLLNALIRNRWKTAKTFLLSPDEYPIFEEETSTSPYQLEVYLQVRHQVSKLLALQYSLQTRYFRPDAKGDNEAYLLNFGLDLFIRIFKDIYWVNSVSGYSGYTIKEFQRLELFGLQLSSGINYRF